MHGLTEDLLNCVAGHIAQNWESRGGDVEYFVEAVRKSGLTAAESPTSWPRAKWLLR